MSYEYKDNVLKDSNDKGYKEILREIEEVRHIQKLILDRLYNIEDILYPKGKARPSEQGW